MNRDEGRYPLLSSSPLEGVEAPGNKVGGKLARGPDESGLHGVYPEQYVEILPLHSVQGQNDRGRKVRNDISV